MTLSVSFGQEDMPTADVIHERCDIRNYRYSYEPALRAMVDYVKAAGKTSIVTGLSQVKARRMPLRDEYDTTARRVANEEGAMFADWGAVRFDPAEMADDIHPLQPYSTRLVERLVLALDEAAPECADPARQG